MATDFPKKGDDKKISLRNSNYPLFDRKFAASVKEDDPKIWKAGGNIEGNNSYRLLLKALDGDDSPAVLRKIKERESWAARHFEDGGQFKSGDKKARPSNIAGVMAQIKWLVIGTLGEQKMKDVILEAVKYLEDKEDRSVERQVSKTVEKGLRKKVEDHNEEHGDDKRKRATYRMLLAVFERGIGAYKTNPSSVRPSVASPEQWAYARVNAFLFALRNLRFPSKNKFDTDLLPKEHPLSSKENGDRIDDMDKAERHIKDVRETEDSYIIEFAKSMSEENNEEARPYHDDEEEKAHHDEGERSSDLDDEPTKEEIDQIAEEEYVAQDSNEDVLRFYAEENLKRAFEFDRTKIDEENRTIMIGVSSEEPVERRFGMEVLGHNEDEIDMAFMAQGRSPLLLDHDATKQIGVVEEFSIDTENKRTVAKVRFSKNQMADEVYRDVLDGIRQNISVGYQVNSMQKEEEERDGVPIYRVNSWSPLEVSAVSIPADQSRLVGFARSKEKKAQIKINQNLNKDIKMDNVENNAPEVNLEDMKRDFAKEAKAIIELGVQHNKRDLANEAIANGASLAQFRGTLLETIANDKPLDLPSNVDMNETEVREYSLLKAVRESAAGTLSGLEKEVSDEIAAKSGKQARGFYMPTNIAFRADQVVGTNNVGGFLKPTDHLGNEFIEALKAKLVVNQAGARVLQGLKGDVAIPKMSAETSNVGFVAENNAPSEGNATFAQVTMSPKTLAAQVDISRKLMMQSDPSIEAVIRNDIVATFARKIDEVAIEGGGSNEPTGVLGGVASGNVITAATNGAAPTYENVVELIRLVEASNAILNEGSLRFLGNAKLTSKLRRVLKSSADTSSNFILENDNSILGYDYLSSTLVPSDLTQGSGSGLSAMIFGDFSQLLIGFYSGVDVIVDPYTGSSAGTTRLAFFQDLDVALRNDVSFSCKKDLITT
jgi:HK97 family phage major capsid protein